MEPRRPQASEPEIAIPLTTPERIVEVKTSLDGRVQEFACDVTAREVDHVVIRYRMVKDHDLHGVSLHAGELTFGYFWFDRPYNLYHWVRTDGATAACASCVIGVLKRGVPNSRPAKPAAASKSCAR